MFPRRDEPPTQEAKRPRARCRLLPPRVLCKHRPLHIRLVDVISVAAYLRLGLRVEHPALEYLQAREMGSSHVQW